MILFQHPENREIYHSDMLQSSSRYCDDNLNLEDNANAIAYTGIATQALVAGWETYFQTMQQEVRFIVLQNRQVCLFREKIKII